MKIINIILLSCLLILSSCTKNFLANNTDPDKSPVLLPGNLIQQMEYHIFPVVYSDESANNYYQLSLSLMGDLYSGQQGTSDAFFNCVNNSTYAMIPGWYGAAFANAYQNAMSPWYKLKQNTQVSTPSTYAIALILKVFAMHRTTDIYGPLPYTKFVPAALNVPYDPQSDIYQSFFSELDQAIAILTDFNSKNPGVLILNGADKIYNGDVSKWLKLANTLKLRLALRVVYANAALAQKNAEEAVAAGVFTTNSENAIINVDGVSTINRLYTITYPFNDTRMGANMESFLKGYNDPRIGLLFNKSTFQGVQADYHGIRPGSQFNGHDYNPFSTLNVNINTPVQLMVAAEAYFLRAEGALRGWNMQGSAQDLYNSGITTAFQQPLGSTQSTAGNATNYINDATSTPAPYQDPLNQGNNIDTGDPNLSTITIKFNSTDSFETNLERIITQKWLAIYPDGQEAWSEFRRTGYPKVFPVANNYSNGVISTSIQIRRSPFPQSEYINDNQSLQQGIKLLGGADNGATKLWWDKK